MKQKLETLLLQAVASLKETGVIAPSINPSVIIEHSKNAQHGDFASNLALILAKASRQNPRQLAQIIVDNLPADSAIAKVQIAGPGFINFFINSDSQLEIVAQILQEGSKFGLSNMGKGEKVQVEFVSANPTGPLHVGHGRGAAYGSAIAGLLAAMGFEVFCEYYVNDAGRQMDILALSVWLRYLEKCGEAVDFPDNGYMGDYIGDIAGDLLQNSGNKYQRQLATDTQQDPNPETQIDNLIASAKDLLGDTLYDEVLQAGLQVILCGIKDDLAEFGVTYQNWFSERSLISSGAIDASIQKLGTKGHTYQKDGNTWFAASKFGDDKDRVLIRANGKHTYFAADVAYHHNKLSRGFGKIINVWGADHHGYIPRVRAAITALGADADKLQVELVQFATLWRGTSKIKMSTRAAEFVSLRQLCREVGSDAARYFYLLRKACQHLDFDLQLAVSKSRDNPIFYVQYAHARVCSVLAAQATKGWQHDISLGTQNISMLATPHEQSLVSALAKYPATLQRAAKQYEPHLLVHYLRELANHLHTYYNASKFLVADDCLRCARLNLICATKQVLANGLTILNITAPEYM